MKKKVIVSVSNDLVTDQRVRKQCASLVDDGYDIVLLGREKPGSKAILRPYPVKRFKLWAHKGAMFYAALNLRLFWFLLWQKADILWANDLDTLPANSLVARLRGIPLVYDSHEYFTEVPELEGRKKVQNTWRWFESKCIKNCQVVITVSPAIVELLQEAYQLKDVVLVRNVPQLLKNIKPFSKAELKMEADSHLLILQGNGINKDRGGEELVVAMKAVENAKLLIVGNGDVVSDLKLLAKSEGVDDKIQFIESMQFDELMRYTATADIGLSLDKDTNINYRFSLPNKIFDYAMAGTAVLAGDLPEVGKVVRTYGIGELCNKISPELISQSINRMLSNPEQLKAYGISGKEFADIVNWQCEFQPVLNRLNKLGKA